MKSRTVNCEYYRTKADGEFMPQFRGQPCAICGKTHATCGHHLIGKGRSKALRYDINNILVLCQEHHTFGMEMAPHSTNHMAVSRFHDWFKENKPDQYVWIEMHEHIQRKYSYKSAWENMKEGREAWI